MEYLGNQNFRIVVIRMLATTLKKLKTFMVQKSIRHLQRTNIPTKHLTEEQKEKIKKKVLKFENRIKTL